MHAQDEAKSRSASMSQAALPMGAEGATEPGLQQNKLAAARQQHVCSFNLRGSRCSAESAVLQMSILFSPCKKEIVLVLGVYDLCSKARACACVALDVFSRTVDADLPSSCSVWAPPLLRAAGVAGSLGAVHGMPYSSPSVFVLWLGLGQGQLGAAAAAGAADSGPPPHRGSGHGAAAPPRRVMFAGPSVSSCPRSSSSLLPMPMQRSSTSTQGHVWGPWPTFLFWVAGKRVAPNACGVGSRKEKWILLSYRRKCIQWVPLPITVKKAGPLLVRSSPVSFCHWGPPSVFAFQKGEPAAVPSAAVSSSKGSGFTDACMDHHIFMCMFLSLGRSQQQCLLPSTKSSISSSEGSDIAC
eukprot:scaffold28583_cov21-Tisochrysis_lutea.AAC.1